jgi:hypothetical protein
MKIDFTETEQPEEAFFKAALAEHDLRFFTGVGEVEADAEILCIYITSRIDAAFLDGGAMEAIQAAKQAGKIRYIGFTGHKDPLGRLPR